MVHKDTVCQVCGNKDILELSKIKNYLFCEKCSVAWLKKTPKTQYKRDYYQGRLEVASKLFKPILDIFYKFRESHVGTKRLRLWIDVGAGEGNFLKTVKAENKIGVEISQVGREIMVEKDLKTLTPKQFLKSAGLNASIISFWHVLEHIENPEDYLKAAERNLNKKGKIIIGIPNIDSWEFKFFGKNWFHLVPEYHIWHFSLKSMEKLLENNGFKINKVDWWSMEHHLTGLLQSFINKSSGTHNFLHKLVKRETDLSSISSKAVLWTIFWLSLGLPLVIIIWVTNSLLKRSGTIVILASKK